MRDGGPFHSSQEPLRRGVVMPMHFLVMLFPLLTVRGRGPFCRIPSREPRNQRTILLLAQ